MAVAAHVVLVPPRNNCERIFPSQSRRFKPPDSAKATAAAGPRAKGPCLHHGSTSTGAMRIHETLHLISSHHSGRHFSRASCTASRRCLDASIRWSSGVSWRRYDYARLALGTPPLAMFSAFLLSIDEWNLELLKGWLLVVPWQHHSRHPNRSSIVQPETLVVHVGMHRFSMRLAFDLLNN